MRKTRSWLPPSWTDPHVKFWLQKSWVDTQDLVCNRKKLQILKRVKSWCERFGRLFPSSMQMWGAVGSIRTNGLSWGTRHWRSRWTANLQHTGGGSNLNNSLLKAWIDYFGHSWGYLTVQSNLYLYRTLNELSKQAQQWASRLHCKPNYPAVLQWLKAPAREKKSMTRSKARLIPRRHPNHLSARTNPRMQLLVAKSFVRQIALIQHRV